MKGIEILNLMGKSNKRLLVHKELEDIDINGTIDIILTPQFYTFLKEELGVKFTYQAKQIAPSLFDDYLDREKEYQYYVYKCDEYWCFFAYSIDEISSFLEEKGLKQHQIGKIFFAQELNPYLQNAISLGDKTALESIDDITTVIPKRLLESEYEYQDLDLNKISLKNGISMGSSYSSLIPLKQTIAITTMLLILGGIFIAEGTIIRNSISGDEAKLEALLDRNPKLSSSRIRKSILQQYEEIDKNEREKRNIIDKISKLLNYNNKLKTLTLDDKKIVAIIDTNNIKSLISEAKRKNLIAKRYGNSQVKVEATL